MLNETDREQKADQQSKQTIESKPTIDIGRWLLLIYHVPSVPSSARAAIWRETKRLGSVSLQHGVCLLPLSEGNRAAYARLTRRVEEYGGEAIVLDTSSPNDTWQQKIIAQFNAARDEEYEEVVDEAERFREEVARERRKGKFTFAEQEDEESNLERLRKYLAQVELRDVWGAQGRGRAEMEVKQCADVLDAFVQEVFEHQSGRDAE